MTPPMLAAASTHVEAFRCTGTSPGRTGRVTATLDLDGGRSETSICYEVHGPAHAPAIVVLGGISAGRHLAPTASDTRLGWWRDVVGTGAALDPARHRLIGIDYLAGPARSASSRLPASVSSQNQAWAVAAVLDSIGVERVTFVGSSYGGMVGLAFAQLFGERLHRLIVLCAAHRTHPMATGLRAIQRRIVRFSVDAGRPVEGLAIARALAMTTYRSSLEFDSRFDWRPLDGSASGFPVEEYLEACGSAFVEHFDPEAYLSLSHSIDAHAVDPTEVAAPTTLVSFDTDALVPPWLADELAERAPGVERHIALSSIYGHDAFLKEVRLVSDVIREVLR